MQTIEKTINGIKIIVRCPSPDEVSERIRQSKLEDLYEILMPKDKTTVSKT